MRSPGKGSGCAALFVAASLLSCEGTSERGETNVVDEGPGQQATPAPRPRELVFGDWLPVAREPSIEAYLERAAALDREPELAIAILNEGLLARPGSAGLYEARGALYRAMGFRRAAQRDLEEAVALEACRGSSWFALGVIRQELGLDRIALDALARARELGIDSVALRVSSARANRAIGRRARAAVDYASAIELQEGTPAYDLLAEALGFVEERGDLARTAPRPGAEIGPLHPSELEVWSASLLSALRFEAVGDSFERSAPPEPTSVAGPTSPARIP